MTGVHCTNCGRLNAEAANFCASCGEPLMVADEPQTMVLRPVDPLLDAPGPVDDVEIDLTELPAAAGVLVVRSGSQAGLRIVLDQEVTSLGRHPESDVTLDDITVSRRHAEIHRRGAVYVVRDAGSLNGTYVNQERVEEAELVNGDEVQIGKFRMVFLAGRGRGA